MRKLTRKEKVAEAQKIIEGLHTNKEITYRQCQTICHITYHIARNNKIKSEKATASKNNR